MPTEILMMGPMSPIERLLEPHVRIHRPWLAADPAALLTEIAPHIRGIVAYSGAAPVDRALLDRLPQLEIVVLMGAGYESVDTAAAKERGVIVANAGAANAVDVAEHAMALVLDVAREVAAGDRYVRAGRWKAEGRMKPAHRLSGRKLGILGLGNIGRAIARCASGFDMPVYYHNRHQVPDVPYHYAESPVALARLVDVLVVAAPGGAETRHLVDAAVLEALGRDGILVNIGRGTVVDEAALIDALANGRLAGAGLDVFEHEPDVPEPLRALPNVVLQPHNGGATWEGIDAAIHVAVDNMLSHFAGGAVVNRIV
jgi:lactate dehydrogenase-like 2-hydroxyacid dehydrogenase